MRISAHDAGLSEVSALAFAQTLRVPADIARRELDEVLFLMGLGSGKAPDSNQGQELSFSCFVIYAVRCVVSHTGIDSGAQSLEKNVEGCIRQMLHSFSES